MKVGVQPSQKMWLTQKWVCGRRKVGMVVGTMGASFLNDPHYFIKLAWKVEESALKPQKWYFLPAKMTFYYNDNYNDKKIYKCHYVNFLCLCSAYFANKFFCIQQLAGCTQPIL